MPFHVSALVAKWCWCNIVIYQKSLLNFLFRFRIHFNSFLISQIQYEVTAYRESKENRKRLAQTYTHFRLSFWLFYFASNFKIKYSLIIKFWYTANIFFLLVFRIANNYFRLLLWLLLLFCFLCLQEVWLARANDRKFYWWQKKDQTCNAKCFVYSSIGLKNLQKNPIHLPKQFIQSQAQHTHSLSSSFFLD